MQWYNPPPQWQTEGDSIKMTAGAKTDFWRTTRHDFIADNGHFYYQEITGDFTAEVKITGHYRDLYDQAGLMARVDALTWLKCGVEYLEGVQQASAVMTREFSDWSIVPLVDNPAFTWFRLSRFGTAVEVYYSLNGTDYTLIRQAYLSDVLTIQVGLMCAAPTGTGFETQFEGFKLA